jgi:hypothetical protein
VIVKLITQKQKENRNKSDIRPKIKNKKSTRSRKNRISVFGLSLGLILPACSPGIGI